LRAFLSIALVVAGGVIFAGDPSDFTKFSYCALPGTTIVACALLLIGFTLWSTE